jgi:diketogulonate reductase-like aldo/keto reductase
MPPDAGQPEAGQHEVGQLGAVTMPRLGQGTWRMGEGGASRAQEADALRLGVDLGMTLIDTAEMYGDGAAEEVVADATQGQRSRVFLVSKVYPHNASRAGVPAACERSLRRLRTDCLDLYLLHWRGQHPVEETVAAFEALRQAGKIRRWGVSNFDIRDMEGLPPALQHPALQHPALQHPGCAANQVLYNPGARGIEFDLLPWSRAHGVPIMAYSPVGQGGRLLRDPALRAVAARHGATPAAIAIAWTLRQPGVVSIPKAADAAHVRQNAAAAALRLTPEDLAELDAAFPPPRRKQPLEML